LLANKPNTFRWLAIRNQISINCFIFALFKAKQQKNPLFISNNFILSIFITTYLLKRPFNAMYDIVVVKWQQK
jgi:hypothetical protein